MFVLKKLVHGNVGGSTVNVLIHNQVFHHSHKKQHSLETCARLLFMLLQDFFASARLHRVRKNFCYQKVLYITCAT